MYSEYGFSTVFPGLEKIHENCGSAPTETTECGEIAARKDVKIYMLRRHCEQKRLHPSPLSDVLEV